ncbi:phosphatidylethanolamine-binding protein [Aspergillus spectabilis]
MWLFNFLHLPLSLLLSSQLCAAQSNPLPPGLPILEFEYPNTPWVSPGDVLRMSDTHPLPRISGAGLNSSASYLLVFVDLDVFYEGISTVILHWYQPDMVVRQRERAWLERGPHRKNGHGPNKHASSSRYTSGAEYMFPRPPPNTHHRYVYLVFEQEEEYEFPGCFGHIFPKTFDARAGFDLRQFVAIAGLGRPVAGNYFVGENDETTVTGTLTTDTSITSRPGPTTTWVRSAPCSQPAVVTPTDTVKVLEHVR